jgi:dTDP-4-amino-4,6-dideoxygalactose transaminase
VDTKIAYHRPISYANFGDIATILASGDVVNGKYVRQLEQHFIDTCKVKYAIACASCTSGLIAVIDAIRRMYDPETVALPLFTWWSTWYALDKNDMIGVPTEINKETWLMHLTEKGLEDVDAAIFVDLFGNMAPKLNTNKPIVYDAAHGYGLSELGQRGIAEVVSFSYTKIVTAMQGGIILTSNDELYQIVKLLVERYFKMEEINALVCLESIKQYEDNQLARKAIIFQYRESIKHNITTQTMTESNNSVFGILFESKDLRDKVAQNLDKNGIGYKVYYEPVFRCNDFKNTNYVYDHILCLPVYPQLTVKQVEFICNVINRT